MIEGDCEWRIGFLLRLVAGGCFGVGAGQEWELPEGRQAQCGGVPEGKRRMGGLTGQAGALC